ncbi:MAG TPA: hypothetical protein PLJ35_19390 [Anaerolineae bacterium]|nr:hypothetical protein [Anaerolineae bacterium]HOR00985.1 hypothetical protein [Anaerolineae bacterium]HPL30038.1 hypothetical protein [Anaerolineae bacterium]
MAEPLVVQIMRRFKAQLLAREAQEMRAMAKAWRGVERALEAQLEALAKELAAEKAAGLEGSQWRLFEKERYQALLRQTRHEINKYIADAERAIADEQAELAALGVQHADAALAASGVHASFSRLPVEAVENMVAMTREGAPLHELLSRTWPDAVEGMTTALVRGTALGWNPRKTAREMRDGLASGLNRVLCIARTEQLRAYREASRAEYAASGVVKGYRRLAAHDSRTCVACLLLDGQFSTLDTALDDHPNGRCAMVPVVDGMPDVTWQTGREWLEGQDAETQRAIMGPGRYDAWREGKVTLSEMLRPLDGGGVGVKSLEELGVGPSRKVMGFTFFRGTAASVAEARAIGEAPDGWARHEVVVREQYLPRFKLEDDLTRTIGLWGSPEPSFSAQLKGRRRSVLAMARAWGQEYGQEGMAVLLPNRQGTGGKVIWDLGRALTDAELDVLLRGIADANDRLAAGLAQRFGLAEAYKLGLSVRENRIAELWVKDDTQQAIGRLLMREALRAIGLGDLNGRWEGGYDFELLLRGTGY